MKYKHVGLHPEELVGGRMIGPGEEVDLTDEQVEENQRLVDEGILASFEDKESKAASKSRPKKEEESS